MIQVLFLVYSYCISIAIPSEGIGSSDIIIEGMVQSVFAIANLFIHQIFLLAIYVLSHLILIVDRDFLISS